MAIENFSAYNYDYYGKLKYHYKPEKGWVNDPNGLIYFNGYYHLFYQHLPNAEVPGPGLIMYWGHARTKDFINWEEMPIALSPDMPYDDGGCWSGTAIIKDDILYVFYASIHYVDEKRIETVSVAYSKDGINFTKYENNPVIDGYPADGFPDFRDPALTYYNGKYYCIMATGSGTAPTDKERFGRLLAYESEDLLNWEYSGIVSEWNDCYFTECPSIIPLNDDKVILSCSVVPTDWKHYFDIMIGSFKDAKFNCEFKGSYDKGPDLYAGQMFKDHLGRILVITWIPGWYLKLPRCAGTWSIPREVTFKNGKIYGYPVKELQHLLKDSDEAVKFTDDGFIVERTDRDPLIYKGPTDNIKILRDGYILEIFVNDGEEVYTVLL